MFPTISSIGSRTKYGEDQLKDRYALLGRGLFPETLPPCFTSLGIKRAMVGLVRNLKDKAFHKRTTDYVPYDGTKHDGTRRYFATPNPISYFHVADFIAEHWQTFNERYRSSPLSVSLPRLAPHTADRPIVIPSFSETTSAASKNLSYCSHILKTDIAQFFSSIYTHAISWSAHGIGIAKTDTNDRSNQNTFNQLDFFVRNCQRGETRGVLVGPDAFRLIAEFVAAGLDRELVDLLPGKIIGAARHVDDYYIGVGSEAEALVALSVLREVLQRYHLNINDAKTKILSGVEPLNELWAQRIRHHALQLNRHANASELTLFLTEALTLSREQHSDSPVKIALRTMDEIETYDDDDLWLILEPYLQRMLHHHTHCIDYVVLLVVKREAMGRRIDLEGWAGAAHAVIGRHLPLNHHHEIVWLLWLLLSLKVPVEERLIEVLEINSNAHIRALLVAAHVEGLITRSPRVRLGSKLATTDAQWLVNLVARSTGFSRASFSGFLTGEFEHLATKRLKLIDLKSYRRSAARYNVPAISRTRYGYDQPDGTRIPNDYEPPSRTLPMEGLEDLF